ncbi:MAG: peptide-methionine (S)-S-oxide reductase [Candidatus Fonsibacter sp.]|nr:peptide-methionine (S)-S-oxide reductase [Candidatus Fonsibacter sp.]
MKKFLVIVYFFFFNSITFSSENKTAYFAGGCFWCMEAAFDKIEGVVSVVSGYSGGTVVNPTYEEVLKGKTGHIETVKITYDSKKITYLELLKNFWMNIDPYDDQGQFCDKGYSYISAIFFQNEEEKKLINKSILEIKSLKANKIKTTFTQYKNFYPAEDYHQKFYIKNPRHYYAYYLGCERLSRLNQLWK